MIVIADSGSTKTQWVVLEGGKVTADLTTVGFNPYYYKTEELTKTLFDELSGHINGTAVEKVFFYGSGCSDVKNCRLVSDSLSRFFVHAEIHTHHDLTGTALALFQNKPGIACILGTGSNSCMWNGTKITRQVPSLGYLLADEGSGTYLGKLILQKILYGEADNQLTKKFYQTYNLDFESTLHRIYGKPDPNKFFASLSKFVNAHLQLDDCRQAVKQSFHDFIEKQISKYPDFNSQEVSFTGSVAFVYQDLLLEVLHEHSIRPGIIMKTPMEGLVAYHTQHL